MAKTSGRTRPPAGGIEGKDRITTYKGKINNLAGIRDIKDERSRLQVQRAISEFERQYGLPTQNVNIATLDGGVVGLGGQDTVILNRQYYDNAAKLIKAKRSAYKSGWSVPTTTPIRHTVIHELAHAQWQSGRPGTPKGLTDGINKLYKRFRAEVRTGKNPLGEYATSNVDEFWAEGITQATIGTKQTYYSRRLKALLKKYGKKG